MYSTCIYCGSPLLTGGTCNCQKYTKKGEVKMELDMSKREETKMELYVLEDECGACNIRTIEEIKNMVKDFEFDYLKSTIEDLYNSSRGRGYKEYGLVFLNQIREIQKWDLKYITEKIDNMTIEQLKERLSNFDITIYKLMEV